VKDNPETIISIEISKTRVVVWERRGNVMIWEGTFESEIRELSVMLSHEERSRDDIKRHLEAS